MPHRALRWILIFFLVLEYARPLGIAQFRLQFVIVLLMAVAFLAAKDRPRSGILLAMLLFFGVVAKSLPFALNTYSVYLEMRGMFGYMVIASAMAWLMSWRGSFHQIVWAWVIILAYCAIYAIAHEGRGPGGLLNDENDMALACCVILPVTLFSFDYLRGWQRWASAGLAVLFAVTVVASFSRGGFIGLVVVSLYYLFSSRHKARKVLVLAVAVTALLTFASQEYLDELGTIRRDARIQEGQDSTARSRLFLWTTAFEMWKANPIMGVGAANFQWQAGTYQPTSGDWPEHYFQRGWSGSAGHSVFFELLSEHGLLGVAVFAYIIWAHFHRLRSLRRTARTQERLPQDLRRDIELYGAALAGGMLGYLACGAFLSVLYYPHFWYLAAMAVALDAAFRREDGEFKDQNGMTNKLDQRWGAQHESRRQISISPKVTK